MKKTKKISKLNVQELEKRVAPAAAAAVANSQGPNHVSTTGADHAADPSVVHSCDNLYGCDPR